MCHLLNIPTPAGILSSEFWLRRKLVKQMDKLRSEDEEIRARGVESLTDEQIILANQERGGRAVGVSREQLNKEVDFWIEMNYAYKLPIPLILYTRSAHILPAPQKLKETVEQKERPITAAPKPVESKPKPKSSPKVESEDSEKLEVLKNLTFTIMKEIKLNRYDVRHLYWF